MHRSQDSLSVIVFDTADQDCAHNERIPEPLFSVRKSALRSEESKDKRSHLQGAEVTAWILSKR